MVKTKVSVETNQTFNKIEVVNEITTTQNQNQVKYVPAGTGPMYCGPGDRVSFLVSGAESQGSCFIIEGMVAPGGGPPPHIHHFEDETFYLLEGTVTFQARGQTIHAKPGDCIHIPRGTVHSLKNEGTVPAGRSSSFRLQVQRACSSSLKNRSLRRRTARHPHR